MANENLKTMTRYALLIALTTVCTMVINIPLPGANGYFNLGDAMVFTAAFLLGKRGGLIAGGIGSALADVLLGFSLWAPFTLVIKGLEGYLAGLLLETSFGKNHPLLALVPAALWMVAGYFVVKLFLYGLAPALMEIPVCLIQTSVGIVAARVFSTALFKTGVFKHAVNLQ